MALELECKLRIEQPYAVAGKLAAAGAAFRGEKFERNRVLDTSAGALREKQMLLRLRTYDGEPGGLLTVKAPAPEAEFKARRETEVRVGDPETALELLRELGYATVWYYEKIRSTWRLDECEVVVDRLPELGCFLEAEGPSAGAIRAVLAKLGLAPGDHLRQNYLELFAAHCAALGEELREMKFSSEKSGKTGIGPKR